MNKGHIKFGETVNLKKLRSDLDPEATHALIRSEDMEVIRMVLSKGKQIAGHKVEGELTIHCLTGEVELEFNGVTQTLKENDWLALEKEVKHALRVKKDAVLLLTILFTDKKSNVENVM
ncbi:MAG: hypothetical protein JXR26_11360 [Balneolaceae bacterium]|nr:hypothetical protein [Balneolaceae bacterium]